MSIIGNTVGCYSPIGKTFVITDDDGNEIIGVVTAQEQIFTATDNDVREGLTYASDDGVSQGSKTIPEYETVSGSQMIKPGCTFTIPLYEKKAYDYTSFQCMVSLVDFDDLDNSVNTNMISVNDGVFEVNSTNKLSNVVKNFETQSIDLNMTNNTENSYFIHYFTYRETSEG